MSDEKDEIRNTAREEFERARERYQQARQEAREARRDERHRARDESRSLRDEIHRTMRESIGGELGKHFGRSIRESMNFNIDLGDIADIAGHEYSEVIERDFAVGAMPRLHVRNVSGDTKVSIGPAGAIHVTARKRVRGTSEERAKRLLENVEVRM